MEKDIQILAIDKNINFNNGTTFHYSKLRDKIGTYGKDKVGSIPIVRYTIVNKIHTHLCVGRYGVE